MFLSREGLGQSISGHEGSREPISSDVLVLNLLPQPATMNIYVFQTRYQSWNLSIHKAQRLSIIVIDDQWLLSIELNSGEKSFPPERLPGRFG